MRRDGALRGIPEGMFGGQRLGIGHVENGVQPTVLQFDDQRVGVHDRTPRSVDHDCSGGEKGEHVGPHQSAGGVGQWGQGDEDIGGGKFDGKFVDSPHAGPSGTGEHRDLGAEGQQHGVKRPADRTVSEDCHPFVRQRVRQRQPPDRFALLGGEAGQLA